MTNDTTNRRRRTVLKALGVSITGLAGLTGNAAAKPGKGNVRVKVSAYGRGRWAIGRGSIVYCGRGYRRDHPHYDDDMEWEPGDGKPPWAGDDDDDDEDDDEEEEEPDEPETHELTVIVTGPDGEPVEDASVSVVTYDGGADVGSSSTDDDGEAEFDVEDGSYEVTVSHDEYLQSSDNRLVDVDGDDTEFEVTLQGDESDTATGVIRVVDQDGEPVEGEPVTVYPPGAVEEESAEEHETNEDGEVVIEILAGEPEDAPLFRAVVRDQEETFAIMSDEHAGVQEVVFEVDSDQMTEFSTTIRVVDQDDEPVEGELVESRRLEENDWSELGTTDENGEVVLTGQSSDPTDAMMFDVRVRETVTPVPLDNTDRTETIEINTDDPEPEPDDPEEEPDTPGPDPEEPEEPEEPDTPGPDPEEPASVAAQIESRIHAATNDYRADNGEPELAFDDEIASVAREHSQDMVDQNYFDHVDREGNGPGDRLDEAGVDCDLWAENIAYEIDSSFSEEDAESVADSIVQGWIGSEGHEANLVGDFDSEGVGVVVDDSLIMATQVFCSGGGS